MKNGLRIRQRIVKRLFDLFFSILGLVIFFPIITIFIVLATITSWKIGLYSQKRVGFQGEIFRMLKIRSMRGGVKMKDITVKDDPRITTFGRFLRKYKFDELPQLWNVFIGEMSLVGPRPDVPGYADKLKGEDRIILTVKPGITGPATLKFRKEEELLAEQEDPIFYNDHIIWKEKVKINIEYVKNWSLSKDVNYIIRTVFG